MSYYTVNTDCGDFFNIGVSGIILILGLSPGTYGNNVCDVSYNYVSLRRKQLKTRLRRAGLLVPVSSLFPKLRPKSPLFPELFGDPPTPGRGWVARKGRPLREKVWGLSPYDATEGIGGSQIPTPRGMGARGVWGAEPPTVRSHTHRELRSHTHTEPMSLTMAACGHIPM